MAFEQHCIVELMGHQRCAGKVSEEQIGGATFIRVDVPKTPNREGFTKFYAPGAIYGITPVDEKTAGMAARAFDQAPIQQWQLSGLLPEPDVEEDDLEMMSDRELDEYLAEEDDEHDPDPDAYYTEQVRQHHLMLDAVEEEREEQQWFDENDDTHANDDEPHNDIGNPDCAIEEGLLTGRELERYQVAQWARQMVEGNALILDTETTGLNDGEIVQIAVINSRGAVMLDTLVKPVMPIPPGATAIHGITDAMVADAPTWAEVAEILRRIIDGRELCIYNAVYDRKMMHQSAEKAGTPKIDWKELANFHCAMERYAEFWGDWNSYHQSYRWQKLTDACDQQGIPEPEAPAHSALGDCLRTLELLKVLAAWQPSAMSEIPL